MSTSNIDEVATHILTKRGCCPRCIFRLIHGDRLHSFAELGILPFSVYHDPLCPACCGLLHHPGLCTLTPNQADVLASCAHRILESNFEYLACELKVITSVILTLRDHVIWDWLIKAAVSSEFPAIDDAADSCSSAVIDKIQSWQRTRVSTKLAWQWLVEEHLATVVKVPFIHCRDELLASLADRFSNTPSSVIEPEHFLLTVQIDLDFVDSDSECRRFCEQLAQTCASIELSQVASNLLHCPARKERRRTFRCIGRMHDPNHESIPVRTPTNQFSKSSLRPIFTLLESLQTPVNFSFEYDTIPRILHSITFKREVPIMLAGRYVKLSRRLPQTPWLVDSCRKLPSSVEELIVNPVLDRFGRSTQITFTSSGREDVDVRCLGLGRPFLLRIGNFETSIERVIRSFSKFYGGFHYPPEGDSSQSTNGFIDLLGMATAINNSSHGKIFVRDLQVVSASEASRFIKQGELEKAKCYRAVCWCPQGVLLEDRMRLFGVFSSDVSYDPHNFFTAVFGPIKVTQRTPLRVLHRRSALERTRTVHSLRFIEYESALQDSRAEFVDYSSWSVVYPVDELFVVELRCEAGTYVKEFVHGDLGRSKPSLASVLGRQVDILSLDVVAVELDWPSRLPDPDISYNTS